MIPNLTQNLTQNFNQYEDFPTRERSLAPKKSKAQSYRELRELVYLAQQFNQPAIDELCERFRPLIYKKKQLEVVKDVFGEDAENELWLIFLQIIHGIDLDTTKRIAGIIEDALEKRLQNAIRDAKSHYETVSYEQCEEEGVQFADTRDGLMPVIDNDFIDRAIDSLDSEVARIFIRFRYGLGLSMKDCASIINRSLKATYRFNKKCLKQLKKKLEEQGYWLVRVRVVEG